MILEILNSMSVGAEIGSALGGFFESEHADDLAQALDILSNAADSDEIDEQDAKEALQYLKRITSDDKTYVQCVSWFYMALCYALLKEYKKSYTFLNKVEGTEVDFFTLQKDIIQETKDSVPEMRDLIKQDEKEWKAEQERIRQEEERKRREEEERMRKELEQKNMIAQSSNTKVNDEKKSSLSLPIVILFSVLLVIITVLVCYIVFKN